MTTPAQLDVRQWLRADGARPLKVLRPTPCGCWSKLSARDGGAYKYGSTEGVCGGVMGGARARARRRGMARAPAPGTSCRAAARTNARTHRCAAGLMQFTPPALPADLNEGYPEQFERKVRRRPAHRATSTACIACGPPHLRTPSRLRSRHHVLLRYTNLSLCAPG